MNAALRPQRGKPKEEAETQLEILWQSEECFLDHRVEEMAMLNRFEDLHCMLCIYIYICICIWMTWIRYIISMDTWILAKTWIYMKSYVCI